MKRPMLSPSRGWLAGALRRRARSMGACFATALLLGGCTHEVVQPKITPKYSDLGDDSKLPGFLHGTVMSRALLGNNTPYTVSTYGLVGQLRGTGDAWNESAIIRQYMHKELARHGFGDPLLSSYRGISPDVVLRDPNYAVVVAEADIPPGARKDDFIDVRVSCLPQNNTTSLAHGMLFESQLRRMGANKLDPGGLVDIDVKAKGPILVNPAYVLDEGLTTGPAKVSLRSGVVMGNARVMADRPIFLQLRHPSLRMARAIESRLWDRFDTTVAAARDEGVVQVYVPRSYHGDWEHFMGIVQHLWLENSAEFNVAKAKMLVADAVKPDAPLEDISYCWEGLGQEALPFILPLLTHPRPEVAFAAARAAAFIGEPTGAAEASLTRMARDENNPFRVSAVEALGQLPSTSALNHMLRDLLDSNQTVIRIEAYKILARNHDPSVYTTVIGPSNDPETQRFILDVCPSDGPPLIYASRQGLPRIAVVGRPPALRSPIAFGAMNNRLTISSTKGSPLVTLFYRDATSSREHTDRRILDPVKILSRPDVAELVSRLGGAGPKDDPHMSLSYSEVIAVIQKLSDDGLIGADDGTQMTNAAFMLQELPRLQNVINTAPVISEAPPTFGSEMSPSIDRQVDAGNVPAISGH